MTIFFQTNTIGDIFKNIQALPSFIMAVNGSFASIHHKYNPYQLQWINKGLLK